MNNKFENEKAWKKKNPKGLLDTYRALHKTEHWTESLFIYIYLKSSICLRTTHLHIYCLLIKQGWRNISSFLLQKKKQSSQRIKPTFVWNCNFDRSFLNHAATNSCVMETAREMTRTSQNQRVVIFDLPHPLPPGQDRFRQFPNPRREKLDLSRGLFGGDGSRSNWTMRKTQNWNRTADHSFEFLFMQIMTWKTEQNLFPCFPNSDHVMVFW